MSDYEGIHGDKGSSDCKIDATSLDKYPKFNVKHDNRNPKFVMGMFFGSRKELKQVIDTYSITDARAIKKWHLEHTCIPVFDNKSLTFTWLANYYEKKFRNSPAYKSSDFRKELRLKLGQHISKWMAWRAKAFKTVLLRIDHRFCVRHLHENFKRAGFKAQTYNDALWGVATATTTHSFKVKMDDMKSLDASAYK
ncbi:hypothetical protein LIER_37348 [Lithospermum erythrorhizon]|uniref:Uncharacterized protein n=1 Tax=Lithospermum erythrorhizon TaxID=34254 RepID=A0AAV3PP50_LITER